MKVDSCRIRSEREQRAWSQEHLASVTGLGLRTIQRIEATGAASYESVGALASVFEVPVTELRLVEPAASSHRSLVGVGWRRKSAALGCALAAILVGVHITRTALAEQVMLDVGVSLNSEERGQGRLLTDFGKNAELTIDGVLSIVIEPTVRDDGVILLTTQIYELASGQRKLLAEPRVATRSATVAEIQLGSESGNVYRFVITPRVE
jgi:DNA-binding XRE family transcriptional regulator